MSEVSSELYIDSMNVAALIRKTYREAHECIASVNAAIESLHDAENALKNSADYADARTPVSYATRLRESTDVAASGLSTLNSALNEGWRAHRDWSEHGHCLAPKNNSDALIAALNNISKTAIELDQIFTELRDESSRYADDETVRFVYDTCRAQADADGATSLRGLSLACSMQSRWISEVMEAADSAK